MGELFAAIPKFSELMPADELKDPTAIAKLPELKRKYEGFEAAALEKMKRPNPLMDEDWGKSKMDIVAEAQNLKQEEDRKRKLSQFLDVYEDEMVVKRELKQAKQNLNDAILEYLEYAL